MKKIITICSVLLFSFLFFQDALAQTIFTEDFETGVASAEWTSFWQGEDNVTVILNSAAPQLLTNGGNHVGLLQDVDVSYMGTALAMAGNVDLMNYSIEADVYCYVDVGTSAYTGLVVYADPVVNTYLKLVADFDASQRFRLYNNHLNMTTMQYSFEHIFLTADVPGGIPTLDGWHHMKIEVRTVNENQTGFWCYFDGQLLTGCPIYDTSDDRMASGQFGLFAMQQDADGIAGYFDNIVVTQLEATSVEDNSEFAVPTEVHLMQNYPNPFNPTTQISYRLESSGHTSLIVSDLLGRQVRTLVSEEQSSGYHTIVWDAKDNSGNIMPSGIYLYTLKTGNILESKKMILMK
ncbi:MAG: hypothetical protein A2V66_02895 [Ignavibacteria bacterium RBG_13_36_8]|nr:MAG: hypothetical protein A2V66_02895 [Ignavibacteria bacterium RBG_13_36_8]